MTCSSFQSVSLEPPIVSFNIQSHSSTLPFLKQSSHFAVNILSSEQIQQSMHFSSYKTLTDFSTIPHYKEDGLALLQGTLGAFICRTETKVEIGDHFVWFGRVEKTIEGIGSQRSLNPQPLVYYQSFDKIK